MAEQTASVLELIRLIAADRPGRNDLPAAIYDDPREEILLDVAVDGARYLLIRIPKPVQIEAQLSPREQEIVRLIAIGYSNKMIAGVLNISSWTVCTHLRRIFSKLGVGSRAAVVARSSEFGKLRPLVDHPEPSTISERHAVSVGERTTLAAATPAASLNSTPGRLTPGSSRTKQTFRRA